MIIDRIINKVERNFHIKEKYERRIQQRFASKILPYFTGKKGIEIGGPSPIFSKELPVYPSIKSLDGCNFSTDTIWEGSIEEGLNYNYYQHNKGYQFISEASNLDKVASEEYDFLLASHCLEHCANPLKTVGEWLRVVKPGGTVLLILPKKEYTFDHKRPVTTLEHLISDLKNNTEETDLTHLDEILAYHDLKLDTAAGNLNSFRNRSLKNYQNRCLHHHVFDFKLLQQICAYMNINVKAQKFIPPYHQIIVGVKG